MHITFLATLILTARLNTDETNRLKHAYQAQLTHTIQTYSTHAWSPLGKKLCDILVCPRQNGTRAGWLHDGRRILYSYASSLQIG
jgi:hypothetical protein